MPNAIAFLSGSGDLFPCETCRTIGPKNFDDFVRTVSLRLSPDPSLHSKTFTAFTQPKHRIRHEPGGWRCVPKADEASCSLVSQISPWTFANGNFPVLARSEKGRGQNPVNGK